jgi:hypothetical protein
MRLHFDRSRWTMIVGVTIAWPDTETKRLEEVAANRVTVVTRLAPTSKTAQ